MDVALINEGTYPYVSGGVSTWCDKLVRGLPEHRFHLVTLVASGDEHQGWELPANAVSLRPVPLWGPPPPRPRRARPQPRVMRAAGAVITGAVRGSSVDFESGLKELALLATEVDLPSALRACDLESHLLDVWRHDAWRDSGSLTMRDAMTAIGLLERSLLPLTVGLEFRPDLCHPVSNGLPTMVALAEKWRHGTPLVMSEHGVYLRERYLAFRELDLPQSVRHVVLGFLRQLTQVGYRNADFVVPVAQFNVRWAERLGADPGSILPIYNGVEPDSYPEITTEPEVPTISWVGRVDPLKDLETLISAYAIVRAKLPDAVLRLFGPTPAGNELYEARCLALADQLGVRDGIRLEGPVPSSRIAAEAGPGGVVQHLRRHALHGDRSDDVWPGDRVYRCRRHRGRGRGCGNARDAPRSGGLRRSLSGAAHRRPASPSARPGGPATCAVHLHSRAVDRELPNALLGCRAGVRVATEWGSFMSADSVLLPAVHERFDGASELLSGRSAVRPVDAFEVAAALEAAGINDTVARQRYGQSDVFALARHRFDKLAVRRATVVDVVPPPIDVRGTLLRGLVFVLPALLTGAVMGRHPELPLVWAVLVAVAVGWAAGQGIAYVGYRVLGAGSKTGARWQMMVLAVLTLVLTSVGGVVAGVLGVVTWPAILLAVGQIAFVLCSSIALVLDRPAVIGLTLVPGLCASFPALVRPDLLPRWLVLAAISTTLLLTLGWVGYLLRGARPPAARLARAAARGALPYVAYGIGLALLLSFARWSTASLRRPIRRSRSPWLR